MKRRWKIICARVQCNLYLLWGNSHGRWEQELIAYDEKNRVVLIAATGGQADGDTLVRVTKIFYQV